MIVFNSFLGSSVKKYIFGFGQFKNAAESRMSRLR